MNNAHCTFISAESWEIMIILEDEIDACILVQFSSILSRLNAIWYCIWNPFSYTDHKNAWEMSLKSLLKTARLISLWIAAMWVFLLLFCAVTFFRTVLASVIYVKYVHSSLVFFLLCLSLVLSLHSLLLFEKKKTICSNLYDQFYSDFGLKIRI